MAIKTSHQTIITLKSSHELSDSLTFKIDEHIVEVVAGEQDRTMRLSFTRQEITELVAALQVHERFA